jgi:hypothetical protein
LADGGALGTGCGLGLGLGALVVGAGGPAGRVGGGCGFGVAKGVAGVWFGPRASRSENHCCWCLWDKIQMPSWMILQCASTRLPTMVSS